MATVTGYTAARMKEIEDTTVVSGEVDQVTKHLMLATRGGVILDAGLLTGPKGDKGDPGLGNVNTVNTKFGPDIVLNAGDVGAVPTTQEATTSIKGIVELATGAEATALTDTVRALTPSGLASVKNARWEKTGSTVAAIGNGLFAGQTALLTLATNTFPLEVIWTGSRWEPVSWKLSGSETQKNAFQASGVCFEGVEWYSTTNKMSKIFDGSGWKTNVSGLVPMTNFTVVNTGGSANVQGSGLINFANVSDLQIQNLFTDEFENYFFRLVYTANIGNLSVYSRPMLGLAPAADSLYYQGGIGSTATGLVRSFGNSGAGAMYTGYGTAGVELFADQTIIRPKKAAATQYSIVGFGYGSDGIGFNYNVSGRHHKNTAYDGLQIYVSAQNMSGNLRVYGYN